MTFLKKKYPSSFITENELRRIFLEIGEPAFDIITTERKQLIKRIDDLKDKIIGVYISEKQFEYLKRVKPKGDEVVNEYLTNDDLKLIDNYFVKHQKSKVKSLQGILIEAFVKGGFRVQELCDFDANNIDQIDEKFRVIGKGAKWRWVHSNTEFINWLLIRKAERTKIIKTKNSYNMDFEPLFINGRGKPFTKRGIQKFMETLNKKIKGLNYPLHPHLLRHTYAVQRIMYEDGLNIEQLKQDMGHEDIKTTQNYFKLADRERRVLSHRQKISKHEKENNNEIIQNKQNNNVQNDENISIDKLDQLKKKCDDLGISIEDYIKLKKGSMK